MDPSVAILAVSFPLEEPFVTPDSPRYGDSASPVVYIFW